MDSEFDQYASDYDALQKDPIRHSFSKDGSFFHERKWLLIRSHLAAQGRDVSRMNWLDVGCGRGELLRLGRAEVASITGSDVSRAMLELCPDIPSRVMPNSESLPFPDHSFDLLTAVCVYHHVPSEKRAALTQEAARVLRPGGVLAVIEHNPLNPATRLIVSRLPMDRNAKLLSAGETRQVLRAAGFANMDTSYFLYLPEKVYRVFPGVEAALRRFPLGGQYAVFARKQ
jgi:ubiquinone/menaquinone biosynthesis C-methylase UbiE